MDPNSKVSSNGSAHAAKPSDRVKRLEQKLRKKMENEAKSLTPDSLKREIESIGKRITSRSKERIKLKNKDVKLFDGNHHVEPVHSHYVHKLRNEIAASMGLATEQGMDTRYPLRGRADIIGL
jgi:hypothetical protein